MAKLDAGPLRDENSAEFMPTTGQAGETVQTAPSNPSIWPLLITKEAPPTPGVFAFRVSVLVLALATATALRAAFGALVPGVPFAFYYPAILAVALLCGWQFGALALLFALALSWFMFVPAAFDFAAPTAAQWISLAAMAGVGLCLVAVTEALRTALARAQASEARYRELLGATSGIVFLTSPSGHVSTPQHGWSEVTGMVWPEYGSLGWLKAVHSDDQAILKGERPPRAHQADLRIWSKDDNNWRWFHMRAVPLTNARAELTGWMSALSDVHERRMARERQEMMLGEQRHRLKNLITVIDSLATWSNPRNDPAVDAYLKKFLGRLRALGGVGDQIVAAEWKELETGAVVRNALAPFLEENSARIRISGPRLMLSEQTAGSLALGIHEMATNALKYGALASKDGKIFVEWSRTPRAGDEDIAFEWREQDGPPVAPPDREGFGLRLIRFVPAREKDGKVQIEYRPAGFYCRISWTAVASG